MTKNTGVPYRTLANNKFDSVLTQNSVNTIIVQHDVVLQAKSVSDRIDVRRKFEVGRIG